MIQVSFIQISFKDGTGIDQESKEQLERYLTNKGYIFKSTRDSINMEEAEEELYFKILHYLSKNSIAPEMLFYRK